MPSGLRHALDHSRHLPDRIRKLLERPDLTGLPGNPVGRMVELLRDVYQDFTEVKLPEILELSDATRVLGEDTPYRSSPDLCRIDDQRILRSDLTLPILTNLRFQGEPLRVWTTGKVYRAEQIDSTHLEVFHQAELLWVDERQRLDRTLAAGKVQQSIERLLPGKTVKFVPTNYSVCAEAWEIEVEQDGKWIEVMGWGIHTDRTVRLLGGDPARHTGVTVCHGLERLAMLRFGIDDVRKIDQVSLGAALE